MTQMKPLTFNVNTGEVECHGKVIVPTPQQSLILRRLVQAAGKPVLLRQIELDCNLLADRGLHDFQRRWQARVEKEFGAGTRGVVKVDGIGFSWRGLVKRMAHVVMGYPLAKSDGSHVTMAEAETHLALESGLQSVAHGKAAMQTIKVMAANTGAFAILATQPNGATMVIVSGDGYEAIKDK
jgi:hypothetical protein